MLGAPSEDQWPGVTSLPHANKISWKQPSRCGSTPLLCSSAFMRTWVNSFSTVCVPHFLNPTNQLDPTPIFCSDTALFYLILFYRPRLHCISCIDWISLGPAPSPLSSHAYCIRITNINYYTTLCYQYYPIPSMVLSCAMCNARGKLRELLPTASFSGGAYLNDTGYDLLTKLLTMDPNQVPLNTPTHV